MSAGPPASIGIVAPFGAEALTDDKFAAPEFAAGAFFGSATEHGGHPILTATEAVSTIAATPSGNGYWIFTNRGRAFAYGDAHFYGDLHNTTLNGPIVASVAT